MVRAGHLCVLVVAAGLLAGCASDSYWGARANMVPGKFSVYTCAQIDGSIRSMQTRIAELAGVQAKAEQETAGALMSPVVYGPTLANLRADLRLLRETRDEKRCPAGASGMTPPY